MDKEKQARIEPGHYLDTNGSNLIDFIEDRITNWVESRLTADQLKNKQVIGFLFGNYLKYFKRAGRKLYPGKNADESRILDMEKAEWYKTRLITQYKINERFFTDTE